MRAMSERQGKFRLLPNDPEIGWTPWAWLVYLVPFIVSPMVSGDRAGSVAAVIATTAFLALYFTAFWSRGLRLVLLMAAMTAIGCAFLPFNGGAAVFFIYAASFAPWVKHRARTTILLTAAISIILITEALWLDLHFLRWIWGLVFALLVPALNFHSAQTSRMNARLRVAQQEIEQLAKAAERERIARDLHDVVGHTLSLIVLKSELASKLAESDPVRAREEIRDVERVSREALAQVRAAISGYRSAGLDRELDNAREALATGQIEVDVVRSDASFSPAEEAVLSLALRESITNVLRHASARHCRIHLEQEGDVRRLIVHDDGRGSAGREGMGLRGMRERVQAIGGTMSVTSDGGTRVAIELPRSAAEHAS
jgi:two-component system sensor histidine kinase DesK